MIRFEGLQWGEGDRSFSFAGLPFITVHGGGAGSEWVAGENCFLFYKTRALVDQYVNFFRSTAAPIRSDNLLELGLFDGGSVPFWFEALQPKKHVGIDISERSDSPFFQKYVADENRRGRIETHWGTSQDDAERLSKLVDTAFNGDLLDIVIDDASHLYEQSRASFEILFSRVRPGGYYILEDWAWSHWHGIEKNFAGRRPLSELVFELVEALGSTSHRLIVDMHLCGGFVAIRRGWTPADELGEFDLDRFIYRHPR